MRTEIHGVAANLVTKRAGSNSFLYLSENTYDETLYPDVPLLMGHDTGKIRIGDVTDVIFTDTQLLFRGELFDPEKFDGTEVGGLYPLQFKPVRIERSLCVLILVLLWLSFACQRKSRASLKNLRRIIAMS